MKHRNPKRHVPYLELLGSRAAWAFLIGKFLTDPVWWFFLFWLPGFLNQQVWTGAFGSGAAAGGDLYGFHGGVGRRRLDFLGADQARMDRESRAQDGDADLRAGRDGVHLRL